MKNNIYYSIEAQNDLDAIWEYISLSLYNSQAAQNTINKIIHTIDRLEDFSEIGARLSSVINMESDYRFLVSGQYIIFYRINGRDVFIDRILYSKRDYLHILFPG